MQRGQLLLMRGPQLVQLRRVRRRRLLCTTPMGHHHPASEGERAENRARDVVNAIATPVWTRVVPRPRNGWHD